MIKSKRFDQFSQIFQDEDLSADFFTQALNASPNLICIAKMSTNVELDKTEIRLYHFNKLFESTVGSFTKIKNRDLRDFLDVGTLFSETEWLSADNISGQKVSGILTTLWNEKIPVQVSWNVFECGPHSYLFFVFDNFPLPERIYQTEKQVQRISPELLETHFFSLKRFGNNLRNQFKISQTEPSELNLKIDSELPDQLLGPESALFSAAQKFFEVIGKRPHEGPVRISISSHPDKPRFLRILFRVEGYFPELTSLSFQQTLFDKLGGDFSTETHTESDSSVYLSVPFDLIEGDIPSSPIPEERLSRLIPPGFSILFITPSATNKIILEHFLDELSIKAAFVQNADEALAFYPQLNPSMILIDSPAGETLSGTTTVERIRSLESTYLAHKAAIVAIVPEDQPEVRKLFLEAGANAGLPANYSRKNLLEAILHFATTVSK